MIFEKQKKHHSKKIKSIKNYILQKSLIENRYLLLIIAANKALRKHVHPIKPRDG